MNKTCNQLQTWKFEGRRITDGEWIELDKHENEPFDQLVTRSFPIDHKEKFDAVRLTQTGKETAGYNHLCINALDVYGNIYKK